MRALRGGCCLALLPSSAEHAEARRGVRLPIARLAAISPPVSPPPGSQATQFCEAWLCEERFELFDAHLRKRFGDAAVLSERHDLSLRYSVRGMGAAKILQSLEPKTLVPPAALPACLLAYGVVGQLRVLLAQVRGATQLADVFRAVESAVELTETYAVNQASFEVIFNSFASSST